MINFGGGKGFIGMMCGGGGHRDEGQEHPELNPKFVYSQVVKTFEKKRLIYISASYFFSQ